MSKTPSRRSFLGIAAGSVAAAAIPGLAGASSGTGVSMEAGFERLRRDWHVNGEIPEGVTYGEESGWNVSLSGLQAASGSRSVGVSLDATDGHGMLWAACPVPVEPGTRYRGSVAVDAWSPDESYNKPSNLHVYVGEDRPTRQEDFPTEGQSWWYNSPVGGINEPLWQTAGWKTYTSNWESPTFESDTIWVAVGVSSRWETELTHYLDDVRLSLDPV